MKAITREEKIMSGENLTPITRKEMFLAKASGQDIETPTPITREEIFLSKITGGGSGGGARAYTVSSFEELPNDAPNGSVGIVESDTHIITYLLNDEVNILSLPLNDGVEITQSNINALCGDVVIDHIGYGSYGPPGVYGLYYTNISDNSSINTDSVVTYTHNPESNYDMAHGWNDEVYKTVKVYNADDDVKEWFNNNGVIAETEQNKILHFYIRENGEWVLMGESESETSNNAGLTRSWDSLIADGLITVENGVITSSDADALVGDLVIADDITSIGDSAFEGCAGLKSVLIPNTVTHIDYEAFLESGLESVTIPNSVTSFGGDCFYGCASLKSVIIKEGVQYIPYNMFSECESLESVIIPDTVLRIEGNAFNGCASLTSIAIPNSVTEIGGEAFWGCRALTSITFNGTVAQWNAITFGDSWNSECPATEVICTDGTVSL